MKGEIVELIFVKSDKKWINITQFGNRIILPQKFKPEQSKKYKCIINHTEKRYIYNNIKYKLSLAKLFIKKDYQETIPASEGTLAVALRKVGFKSSSNLK